MMTLNERRISVSTTTLNDLGSMFVSKMTSNDKAAGFGRLINSVVD